MSHGFCLLSHDPHDSQPMDEGSPDGRHHERPNDCSMFPALTACPLDLASNISSHLSLFLDRICEIQPGDHLSLMRLPLDFFDPNVHTHTGCVMMGHLNCTCISPPRVCTSCTWTGQYTENGRGNGRLISEWNLLSCLWPSRRVVEEMGATSGRQERDTRIQKQLMAHTHIHRILHLAAISLLWKRFFLLKQ